MNNNSFESITFDKMCGQEKNRELLAVVAKAAKLRGEVPEHIIIAGGEEAVRKELAFAFANTAECYANYVSAMSLYQMTPFSWANMIIEAQNNTCHIVNFRGSLKKEQVETLVDALDFDMEIESGKRYKSTMEIMLPEFCMVLLAENIDDIPLEICNVITEVYKVSDDNNTTSRSILDNLICNRNIILSEDMIRVIIKESFTRKQLLRIVKQLEVYQYKLGYIDMETLEKVILSELRLMAEN